MTVDLSAYAGEEMEVIFNTNTSGPRACRTIRATTCALWGAPEIIVR